MADGGDHAMKSMDLGRLGIAGVAGVALCLFCLSFGLDTVLPAQKELERLRKTEIQLAATAAQLTPAAGKPAITRVTLPPLAGAAEVLEQFAASGKKFKLPVEQASYRFIKEDGSTRYEVILPLKTNYATLRGFLDGALAASPVATLDELTLRRATAVDPVIEANIRLSYHFDGS